MDDYEEELRAFSRKREWEREREKHKKRLNTSPSDSEEEASGSHRKKKVKERNKKSERSIKMKEISADDTDGNILCIQMYIVYYIIIPAHTLFCNHTPACML